MMERDWDQGYGIAERMDRTPLPVKPITQLAVAFKYIVIAIIQKRAEYVMYMDHGRAVPWLTPVEVLELIEVLRPSPGGREFSLHGIRSKKVTP